MDVRPLDSRRDLRGVHRVNVLAWREAYDGILPESVLEDRSVDLPPGDAAAQYDRIRSQPGCFLVAVDDDDVVHGYLFLRWDDDSKGFVGEDEAGLKEIYVEPGYWGEGVGTRLLDRALDELPDTIEAVKLEMLAGNDVAQSFYESHGFEQVGSTEFELGEDTYPTDIYEKQV
jgi:ribosomal protein S18 acetylase RimI-like enzyme